MGTQIINEGADYSAPGKNLGNINKSFQFVDKGVPPNADQPIKSFYKSLKDSGLLPFIDALYIFLGGGADSFNLINPKNEDSAYRLTFSGDSPGRHTSTGWALQPGINADTHHEFEGGDIGLFAYTTAAQTNEGVLIGATNATNNIFLYRNYGGGSGMNYTQSGFDASTQINDSSVYNGTGFLGAVKSGSQIRIYAGSDLKATKTNNVTLSGFTGFGFAINGIGNPQGPPIIQCTTKIGMAAITKGMSNNQCIVFAQLVNALANSLGW